MRPIRDRVSDFFVSIVLWIYQKTIGRNKKHWCEACQEWK